jgi:anti-sigma factor RsiW
VSCSTDQASGDGHKEAQQLLPWLLTGTLEGAELARVQAHLGTCERCRADLAWERRIRAAGQPRGTALDPDPALAKLLPCLGRQEARHAVPGRWRGAAGANDGRWLRALAVAQLGVIAVLALLLAYPDDDDAHYRGLGAAAPAQDGGLVVVFNPDTPERELRRILQASGARVVDGPTMTDAYVLEVPRSRQASTLTRLRAEPGVILAQPLTTESGP